MHPGAQSEEQDRRDLPLLPMVAATSCCCTAPSLRQRLKTSDMSLSLLGVVGWFLLPKCPLCLAAYLAIGAGLSLTATQSRILYVTLSVFAVGLFAWGVLRVLVALWRRSDVACEAARNTLDAAAE